ncbi:MAG: AAA family ATPase [Clostridia bacterium]|nr:AAA family ATPase [Clostridia bacterium]
MQIDRVYIIAFGGVRKRELLFSSGFEIVCRENEWGKTTLMLFIRMMLFGKTDRAVREKIRPQSGENPAGEMDITVDGVRYRIAKTFMKTEKTDKVSVMCLDTGKEIPLSSGEEVGTRLLGLDAESFMRCMFIPEEDGTENTGSGASLHARLRNLAQSGSETVNYDKIMARLDKAIRDADRNIRELSRCVTALSLKLTVVEAEAEKKQAAMKTKQALQAEVLRLEEACRLGLAATEAKEARQLLERADRQEKKRQQLLCVKESLLSDIPLEEMESFVLTCRNLYHTYTSLNVPEAHTEEEEAEFEERRQRLSEYKEKPLPPKPKLSLWFWVVLFFMAISISFATKMFFVWGLVLLLAVTSFFIYTSYKKTGKKFASQIAKREMEIADATRTFAMFLKAHEVSSVEEWHAARLLHTKLSEEKENAKVMFLAQIARFQSVVSMEEAEALLLWLEEQMTDLQRLSLEMSEEAALTPEKRAALEHAAQKSNAPADWEAVHRTQELLKEAQEALLRADAQARAFVEDPTVLEKEKQRFMQKISDYEEYKAALFAAKEVYTEAMERMMKNLRPDVNRRASAYMQRMTNGIYDEIQVDKAIITAHTKGRSFEEDTVSRGTRGQLYLAMRLSYGVLLGRKEPVFLFLDDALRDFDEQRAMAAIRLLSEEAGKHFSQIVLFTCQHRFEEYIQ